MKWIDVSEQTPPLNEPLLFVSHEGKVCIGYCYDDRFYCEKENSSHFKDLYSDVHIIGTHWAELPQPPSRKSLEIEHPPLRMCC
jgi:Protein of unknown function (DUF551)